MSSSGSCPYGPSQSNFAPLASTSSPPGTSTDAPYNQAIPILVAHLKDESYDQEARAAIARALAVPEARANWRDLVDLYRQTSPEKDQLKEALAAAITVIAERAVANELIDLLFDAQLGPSRLLLLKAFTRLRLPHTWTLITQALADTDLTTHEHQGISVGELL